jgi:hypothetical protein
MNNIPTVVIVIIAVLLVGIFVLLLPTYATADLKAVVDVEDKRIAERKVYLRYEWSESELTTCEAYLPKGEVPTEQSWELLFENTEVMRQAFQVAKHNPNGQKITVRAREVQTLRGRGLLIESIRSSW